MRKDLSAVIWAQWLQRKEGRFLWTLPASSVLLLEPTGEPVIFKVVGLSLFGSAGFFSEPINVLQYPRPQTARAVCGTEITVEYGVKRAETLGCN